MFTLLSAENVPELLKHQQNLLPVLTHVVMNCNRTVCLEPNFKFFSVRWQKIALSAQPQLITPTGGEEKMQADATPNKLSANKKQAAHVLAFCACLN